MAFVLQDSTAGTGALGGGGDELGVGGIGGPGLALTFNLYAGSGVGAGFSSTVSGTLSQGTYQSLSPVALNNDDPKNIVITYNAAVQTLTEQVTDTDANATQTLTDTGVNLNALFGGNSAYLGFTGATGGAASTQTIGNFSFQSSSGSPRQRR